MWLVCIDFAASELFHVRAVNVLLANYTHIAGSTSQRLAS